MGDEILELQADELQATKIVGCISFDMDAAIECLTGGFVDQCCPLILIDGCNMLLNNEPVIF